MTKPKRGAKLLVHYPSWHDAAYDRGQHRFVPERIGALLQTALDDATGRCHVPRVDARVAARAIFGAVVPRREDEDGLAACGRYLQAGIIYSDCLKLLRRVADGGTLTSGPEPALDLCRAWLQMPLSPKQQGRRRVKAGLKRRCTRGRRPKGSGKQRKWTPEMMRLFAVEG
jgi:hypothetical protein